MKCVFIGKQFVWLFHAPNQEAADFIVNTVAVFELFAWGKTVSGFSPEFGVWEARGYDPKDEIIVAMLDSALKSKKTKLVTVVSD